MAQPKFKIFAGSSHPELAKEIAKALKKPLGKVKLSTFACGEKYIAYEESFRGHDVFIVQTCTQPNVNEDLMELFLMVNAAKLSFANRVHVIIPHFGYARQDKIHVPREPISAKLMADLLVQAGADHVMTFQLHADQNQAFFDVPVDNFNADKLFADYIKKKKLKNITIISPDAGGAKNAKKFGDLLGAPIAILHKSRPGHNKSVVTHVVGDVKNRTCIIFDDMVDTGGSVVNAKEALLAHGAKKEMYLCATHPVFSDPAAKRLAKAKFTEVIVANSMPIPKEKQFKGLKQISIAPLLANAIDSITQQKSVSKLFF